MITSSHVPTEIATSCGTTNSENLKPGKTASPQPKTKTTLRRGEESELKLTRIQTLRPSRPISGKE